MAAAQIRASIAAAIGAALVADAGEGVRGHGPASYFRVEGGPHAGRRIWQPAYGLFIIGCLLGLAYIVGGRSLWLPIAVHGAAIFGIEVMRLYLVFRGPQWLLGYAEFPQSGLLGGLLVLGTAIGLVLLI
jgi:hypothetical protein